jgi:SAM-dependent methyltransferase
MIFRRCGFDGRAGAGKGLLPSSLEVLGKNRHSRSIRLAIRDRPHNALDEHIKFARRTQFLSDPLELGLHLLRLRSKKHVGKQRDRCRQTPKSDPDLVQARTRPGVKMTNFQVGDAQNLPFADRSFDIATMALVISFLPNPDKAAAEMARVVRPGGWVAAYMWNGPGGGTPVYPIYLALESMGMTSVRPPNPAASGRDAMQGLWKNAGLESVETRVIRSYRRHVSERQRKLRTRLRDHLPASSDGRIVYESFANAVKGRVPA